MNGADGMAMGSGCPGVPDRCEHSQSLISQVLEGMPDAGQISAARSELGHCLPCVSRIDLQIRYKEAMSAQSIEAAPASLQLRISDTLRRVDLGEIDISDL